MVQANLLRSRHFIKINACLIGYGIWIILSQHQIITSKIKAPVCFYKTPENFIIIGPDTVDLVISSQKRNLLKFDAYNSAIHIDASILHEGNNHILLQKQNLFLPDEINLVSLVPSSLQIQLQKAE